MLGCEQRRSTCSLVLRRIQCETGLQGVNVKANTRESEPHINPLRRETRGER